MKGSLHKIGIIGGTVTIDESMLKNIRKIKVRTPYGSPSSPILRGKLGEKEVFILRRHGEKHTINPSMVNYRANLWAFKKLGVAQVIGVNAVGSLSEEYMPGDMVFPDQFIDLTKFRKNTFYDGKKVCHISSADPFCPELRKVLIGSASKLKLPHHEAGTCVVIEGPRFSTRAESGVFRSWNAHIINMTMFPEVILARELELCYANISMVTDYDVWRDHPVSNEEVVQTMKKNAEKVRRLLLEAIPKIPRERLCACKNALKGAMF
ncbi:MAG: S-methyl-5'-thioadenosine phosphorylase [Candidatus Woesearchaeota archaeon]